MPTLPTLSVAHEVRAIAQDADDYPGDGSQCECCGLGLDVEQAACGHWFCYVCRGRGHDTDCDGDAGHSRPVDGAARSERR